MDTIDILHIIISNMKASANSVGWSSKDINHVKDLLISDNGEGIVVRSQASFYHPGRSNFLLKYKVICMVHTIC